MEVGEAPFNSVLQSALVTCILPTEMNAVSDNDAMVLCNSLDVDV